jgi:4'-phosphopantetheinyl transferase
MSAKRQHQPAATSTLSVARVALADVTASARSVTALLHPVERAHADGLSVPKRRVEFIAGRAAAKRALGRLLPRLPPSSISVVATAAGPRQGAPVAIGPEGEPLRLSLSISHGAGYAVCCAATRGDIGLDIERVEARHDAFIDEAFPGGELGEWSRALGIAIHDPRITTLAWSAKEALLKLAGVGLRAPLGAYVVRRLAWCAPPAEAFGFPLHWARATTDELGECLIGAHVDEAEALALAWRG